MHAVLNSALSIFALILTGFVCGYFGAFDRVATDNLNRFAVYLTLPLLIFVAMSKITAEQVRQFGFVAAFCGGFAISFAAAFAISRFRGRRVANASVEGLDAGYSNVGFMRIPMCLPLGCKVRRSRSLQPCSTHACCFSLRWWSLKSI